MLEFEVRPCSSRLLPASAALAAADPHGGGVAPRRVRHHVKVQSASTGRYVALAVTAVGVLFLAGGHIVFGLANFQPGFPKLEGVASITAGLALLASLVVAVRSMYWALLTACLGSLPLVGWFAYAVPIEGSSDPSFFWASLVIPTASGLAALTWRRRNGRTTPRAGTG